MIRYPHDYYPEEHNLAHERALKLNRLGNIAWVEAAEPAATGHQRSRVRCFLTGELISALESTGKYAVGAA